MKKNKQLYDKNDNSFQQKEKRKKSKKEEEKAEIDIIIGKRNRERKLETKITAGRMNEIKIESSGE